MKKLPVVSVVNSENGSENALENELNAPNKLLLERSASSAACINYLAGVAGGVSVVFVGHPFDTIKTRMQSAPAGFYKGTIDTVQQTMRFEGPKGFYAGLASPLLGQMFFRAASFMTFYATVRAVSTSPTFGGVPMGASGKLPSPTSAQLLLSGGITGLVISAIETPIDLVKTKLQIQIFEARLNPKAIPAFTTFRGCVEHIIKTDGVRALFQGSSATILRNVPANALFFPINEIVKQKLALNANCTIADLSISEKLVAGASAGLGYWILTYPLDAVKGRVMATPFVDRRSWLSVAKTLKFSEFFVGIVPCAVRSLFACSAMFYTVDVVRANLEKRLD